MTFNAFGAHTYAGGLAYGVSRHLNLVGLGEHDGYGDAIKALNFPDVPRYPQFVDWPRVRGRGAGRTHFIFANPPCFSPDTKVLTEAGWMRIDTIVHRRLGLNVMTVTEGGKLTSRPVTGWHRNRYSGAIYDVSLGRGRTRARATANHKFLTRRGWVEVANLNGEDEICSGRYGPNAAQRELLDGMMLGDAQIKKYQAQLHVVQSHHSYTALKAKALGSFVSKTWAETEGTECGDYIRKPRAGFYLRTEPWVELLRGRWYSQNRARCVPHDLVLTPRVLAVWYMDDGTLRKVNSSEPGANQRANGGYGGSAHLCTDRYSQNDVERLIHELGSIGVTAHLIRSHGYGRIAIDAAGFKTFIDLIGPYVPLEMRYKLPIWAPAFDPSLWDIDHDRELTWERPEIRFVKNITEEDVYCLDVEETHNFVTFGGVAHNCAPFSVAAAGRATSWRHDPRLRFFHDIFGLLPDVEPEVLAIESVTQSWTKGKELVDTLARDAARWGYSTTVLLHNARHVGNVQNRKRVFYVFHKIAVDWDPPDFEPTLTVGRVLKGIKVTAAERRRYPEVQLTGLRQRLWEESPPGGNLRNTYDELFPKPKLNPNGTVQGRPGFLSYKLDPNRSGLVFIGSNHILHPTEPRALYPSEINALVGFPPDWRWPEELRTDRLSVFASQGVSPTVGAWLAKGIRASLERGKRLNRPTYALRDELRPPGTRLILSEAPQELDLVPWTPPAAPAAAPPSAPRQAASARDQRPGRPGSGAYIRELLIQGVPRDEILRLNLERFPASKAGPSDVAWNRGRLRQEGVKL